MPTNDGSSIDSGGLNRSNHLQKMPSSTYSDSEDDTERKAQIDMNNRWNVSEEGDTRTHIVQEIFQNEQSYVEDLQTVIVKYLNVLKTPEYAGMIDSKTVDEIFFMVPEILSIHERFLNELRRRLEVWEPQQMVGDAFTEAFSKPDVLETYTLFVNNCNRAKDAIRMTCQARPAFSRFLQNTSREHKGKLTLDNLLIKPVQKFPNYELLFRRLIKHTDIDHPDQKPLQDALKLAHDILLHINAKKKEGQENGQREAALRELEGVIEGINDLVAPDRNFIALDVVSMPNGQGARKERGFFLFSDLLVITSIKRRSGTIRKPNTTVCPGSVASTLDTNKYKFLMKIPLDNMEIVKSKDESVRKIMSEIDQLVDDCNKIQQISKIVSSLRYPHQHLEETLKDLHRDIDSQLKDLKSQDNQLNMLELTFQLPNGIQNITVAFSKPETRSQWEENFNDAKQKLAASLERHPIPEFLTSIPIRKTRAGLQFTCAAPTLSSQKDVWVCNSDGYVGQVCVLSLFPEPTVTSCNGVCNARILCVASVPACNDLNDQHSISSSNCETPRSSRNSNSSTCPSVDKKHTKSKTDTGSDIKLDSSSSSSDSEPDNQEPAPSPSPAVSAHHHQDSSDDTDGLQSTMWLGTEDGCIHVYNCTDNIRIKKNKIKIQHVSAVYSILYLDNRVFVSLANGDICVYLRDSSGWNTTSPHCLPIGSVTSPVNRLLNVQGKLWCSIQGIIKVLDTKTLQVENQIQISSDSKPITNMAVSANNVWISIQNSAHIKCFHSNSYEQIFEVNLAPSVNKMLCNCDDIIRQHKAACLRVTSLLACKDLIWIGTSAGVLLTIPSQGYSKGNTMNNTPVVTGIPHGHTGHVRFLTFVETESSTSSSSSDENGSIGYGTTERKNKRNSSHSKSKPETSNVLIISGGDGYEDFRSSGANTMSEVAGREDSTNHLLLWQM